MALPTVTSIEDCGNYYKTLEPFLPQLYDLPTKLLENYSDHDALLQIYLETNPFVSAGAFSLFMASLLFLVAEVNRNFSQVDRFWSILPGVYNVHFAVWARLAGVPHARSDLAALFAVLWSVRLTFNYWRRGGYQKGSEDYRWTIVQTYVHPVLFSIFDLVFVSFTQIILIFLFSSAPAYVLLLTSNFAPGITTADLAFFGLLALLILIEYVSDGQQWDYQTAKYKYQANAKPQPGYDQASLDRGFNTSGLWAYSRHPNCAAEQLIWLGFYQWACYACDNLYNWSGVGAGSLILLFQGSTLLTEAITGSKYPEYREYKKQVARFFPFSLKPYQAPDIKPKAATSEPPAKRSRRKRA